MAYRDGTYLAASLKFPQSDAGAAARPSRAFVPVQRFAASLAVRTDIKLLAIVAWIAIAAGVDES